MNKKTGIKNSRTRTKKVKAQAEYTEAKKKVKSIRHDKQKYMEDLATTAKKAKRQPYDTAKKLTRKYSKPERLVKDTEGRQPPRLKNRWVEYFEELLNRPAPLNPLNIEAVYRDDTPPTTEEIRLAIR
ncbi:unnamed protein product [Schistosoma mattheei]|uniref:Uncharacterized protein n=1 Tax=Schistosoma mattheei TaxID=31246 RepID=A0A183P3K0_9TREM|nr:unnamed protein product [Schistosoma mattheei]